MNLLDTKTSSVPVGLFGADLYFDENIIPI